MNSHRPLFLLFLVLLLGATAELCAQSETKSEKDAVSIVPRRQPISRYREGWKFSPFMVKTNVVTKGPNFAEDLSIAGISIIRGEAYVTVVNGKTKDYTRLQKDKETDGLTLLEVSYDRDPRKASVRISSGDEQASIRYSDEAFKARPGAIAQSLHNSQQPPGVQRVAPRRQAVNGQAMPPLTRSPSLQRSPTPTVAPLNAPPTTPPQSRRRKIILPTAVQPPVQR